MESPRADRPKPKVELFGRREKQVDLDDDEDTERKTFSSARQRRGFMKESKSTTRSSSLSDRKTPTGRETPTGRKTPTGRQTPTKKQTKFDLKGIFAGFIYISVVVVFFISNFHH